ncbi:serine hydrolase domain-containing protein [Actinophytocola glycyrrhizae]|uniref:Serine hydrolase domain-containing protein n=1 Tax=Actinophytocola glycyrrhizae TaxID=2044873 RepID=A0ABV9RVN4_9PSEU
MRRLVTIAVAGSAGLALLVAPAGADSRPPLKPADLEAAIAGLPDAEASGALLQVRGRDGEWQGTSGVANVHTGQKVPVNGRFRIGSMTKTFTATAALQLVAKRKLDPRRTVQSYAPDLLPAGYPPITIDHLLTYTSGLPGMDIDHKDPVWFLRHRFDTWTPRQLFDLAFHREDGTVKEMLFHPGSAQKYGNIDYLVLGAVIEEVTGRPYGDAIRDGVIRPLHLSATSVPGTDTRIRGPHARGYEEHDGTYTDITAANPTYQWAAAEMISNAPDLDRFLTALLSGKLLPRAQTALLFRIPDVKVHNSDQDAYLGHGIARLPVGDIVFWGKTGDRPGYNSGMAATRDLGRRVVFSVNTLHMGGSEQPVVSQKIIAAVSGLA